MMMPNDSGCRGIRPGLGGGVQPGACCCCCCQAGTCWASGGAEAGAAHGEVPPAPGAAGVGGCQPWLSVTGDALPRPLNRALLDLMLSHSATLVRKLHDNEEAYERQGS